MTYDELQEAIERAKNDLDEWAAPSEMSRGFAIEFYEDVALHCSSMARAMRGEL